MSAEATNNLAQMASAQGRYAQAAALFMEGLLLSKDVGDMLRLLAALGPPRRAARLGGAAEAERERLGVPPGLPDRTWRDRAIQGMRAALGEEMFAAAWAEGQGMTLAEASALARKSDPTG